VSGKRNSLKREKVKHVKKKGTSRRKMGPEKCTTLKGGGHPKLMWGMRQRKRHGGGSPKNLIGSKEGGMRTQGGARGKKGIEKRER